MAAAGAPTAQKPPGPPAPAQIAVSGDEIFTDVEDADPAYAGKPKYKMWAHDATGLVAGGKTYTADLNDVTAILFDKGLPQARMQAPHAQGDSAAERITATGRATVLSLAQPGTRLVADTITWFGRKDEVDATGHVYYYDSVHAVTIQAPRLTADTGLKRVSTRGAGSAQMPRNGKPRLQRQKSY
jgi:hypothetical protein